MSHLSSLSLSPAIPRPPTQLQKHHHQMCGATTTLIYGANLVLDPVSEEPVKDESSDVPGMVKVAVPYHVRVMVPCYSEPLDIISKTCEAAQRAALPAGCRVSCLILLSFFFFRVERARPVGAPKTLLKQKKTHSSSSPLSLSFFLFLSLSLFPPLLSPKTIKKHITRSPSTSATTARTPRSAAGAWRPGAASSTSLAARAPRAR